MGMELGLMEHDIETLRIFADIDGDGNISIEEVCEDLRR